MPNQPQRQIQNILIVAKEEQAVPCSRRLTRGITTTMSQRNGVARKMTLPVSVFLETNLQSDEMAIYILLFIDDDRVSFNFSRPAAVIINGLFSF